MTAERWRRLPAPMRQWAWYVSALAYRWSYVAVAHQTDDEAFTYLGERLAGAHVVDCGCGPGLVSEKLARRAGRVTAVDANPLMVRQARARLAQWERAGKVAVVHALVDAEFLGRLDPPPDVVLFKRSLYAAEAAAVATLRAAAAAVGPAGTVIVVHPERSLVRYAFGSPARLRSHTAFHLFNRLISRIAAAAGISEYRALAAPDLERILRAAAPSGAVERIPTTQHAYNLRAIRAG